MIKPGGWEKNTQKRRKVQHFPLCREVDGNSALLELSTAAAAGFCPGLDARWKLLPLGSPGASSLCSSWCQALCQSLVQSVAAQRFCRSVPDPVPVPAVLQCAAHAELLSQGKLLPSHLPSQPWQLHFEELVPDEQKASWKLRCVSRTDFSGPQVGEGVCTPHREEFLPNIPSNSAIPLRAAIPPCPMTT